MNKNKETINSSVINEDITLATNAPTLKQGHHNNNLSTQLQLLGLAKRFRLDGEIIPSDERLPLPERALDRVQYSQLLKQNNIENIIRKSIEYCSTEEITDKIEQDWFTHFIGIAENVSNKTMQALWAKILAKEVSRAGSFSLKSLKAFQLMSIHEAKLFAKACNIAVSDRNKSNFRILTGAYQVPGLFNFFSSNREQKINLNKFGLSYSELLTLADNHLIFIQEAESTSLNKKEEVTFYYHNHTLNLQPKKNNCILNFYKFTPVGTELARLVSESINDGYLQELKDSIGTYFNINMQ